MMDGRCPSSHYYPDLQFHSAIAAALVDCRRILDAYIYRAWGKMFASAPERSNWPEDPAKLEPTNKQGEYRPDDNDDDVFDLRSTRDLA